jgi:RTX calcium-binding nonapeptide repeat (4 copies)
VLLPLPFLRVWAAGGEPASGSSLRIAELVGSSSGGGLVKAGVAVVAAGVVAAGAGTVVHDQARQAPAHKGAMTSHGARADSGGARPLPASKGPGRGKAHRPSGHPGPGTGLPPTEGDRTTGGKGAPPTDTTGGHGDGSAGPPQSANPAAPTSTGSAGGSDGRGGADTGGSSPPPQGVSVSGNTLYFRGGPGEPNHLKFALSDGRYVVTDVLGAAVSATPPCEQISSSSADCPSTETRMIDVETGDGWDEVRFSPSVTLPATVSGGEGRDALFGGRNERIVLNGGEGNDLLFAGATNSVVNGGPGDDWLYGNWGGIAVRLNAGDGADHIFAAEGETDDAIECGDGSDQVTADAASIDADSIIAPDCEEVTRLDAP